MTAQRWSDDPDRHEDLDRLEVWYPLSSLDWIVERLRARERRAMSIDDPLLPFGDLQVRASWLRRPFLCGFLLPEREDDDDMCWCCTHDASEHIYNGSNRFPQPCAERRCPCTDYAPKCPICWGWSPTARPSHHNGQTRACRPCRRLIKRVERKLWRTEYQEWRSNIRELRSLAEGAKILRMLRTKRGREALRSAHVASERARTSRIS